MNLFFSVLTGLVTSIIYDFLKRLFSADNASTKRSDYPKDYIRSIKIMFYLNLVIGCAWLYYTDPKTEPLSTKVIGIVFIILAVNAFVVSVELAQDFLNEDTDKKT